MNIEIVKFTISAQKFVVYIKYAKQIQLTNIGRKLVILYKTLLICICWLAVSSTYASQKSSSCYDIFAGDTSRKKMKESFAHLESLVENISHTARKDVVADIVDWGFKSASLFKQPAAVLPLLKKLSMDTQEEVRYETAKQITRLLEGIAYKNPAFVKEVTYIYIGKACKR